MAFAADAVAHKGDGVAPTFDGPHEMGHDLRRNSRAEPFEDRLLFRAVRVSSPEQGLGLVQAFDEGVHLDGIWPTNQRAAARPRSAVRIDVHEAGAEFRL